MMVVGGFEKMIGCFGKSLEVSKLRADSATCST